MDTKAFTEDEQHELSSVLQYLSRMLFDFIGSCVDECENIIEIGGSNY